VSRSYGVTVTKEALIRILNLRPHEAEGGYFSEQYLSRSWFVGDGRPALDTIYYMLTEDSPIGHFHLNRSDIVHFYHAGAPLRYTTIDPSGNVEIFVLGPDVADGQLPQRVVASGYWKATELTAGSFGLISEAVVPAFSAKERIIATRSQLAELFPGLDEGLLALAWV
jgi:uncharacterized protein